MIEDLITWLQLANHNALITKITTNQSASNLVALFYLLSIKRSWRYAVAFLFCESAVLLIEFHPINFYLFLGLAWSFPSKIETNLKTCTANATMILFLMIMAMDTYFNAHTETVVYIYYEYIIVCIHAAIVLSFYDTARGFNGMVNFFRAFMHLPMRSYNH